MKDWLTIMLLGLALTSYGQSLSDIEKRLRLLDGQGNFQSDTTGFSALPQFDYLCNDEHQPDNYLVSDLNFDGLNDLIFSGACNPYAQTGIFLNSGPNLKEVFNYAGEIIAIEKTHEKTIINVLKKACCCDPYSDYIQITIDSKSNVTINRITFDGNTKIVLDNELKEIRTKGTIRTAAKIDDKNKRDPCRDAIIKGNHLVYIDQLKPVVQLSIEGQWRLVLYQENVSQSWLGWMRVER